MRLDAYRAQLNAMVQQFQYLANSRTDHLRARESLEGLERTPEGTAVLVPIGGDVLLPAAPDRQARVLVGLGSGVVVEMERPKASELLAQRMERIDQAARDLDMQIRTLEERIQGLAQRLDAAGHAADGASDDVGRH